MAVYSIKDLELKAKQIRRTVVDMIYNAKSGHLGGSLSMVDMLVALYYAKLSFAEILYFMNEIPSAQP